MKCVDSLYRRSWLFSTALFTVISTSLLPLSLVTAQPSATAQPSGMGLSRWEQMLISMEPRGGVPGGGRTVGSCVIIGFAAFPSNQNPGIIWGDRPMFVWQGTLEAVEVRSADGQQLVESLDLSQVDANESIHAIQLEQALTPGETYGLVFKAPYTQATLPIPFQVMAASERAQISADLNALAAQGGTAEEIAVRQADYFGDRQLWGDFWQTVLAVENPSAELKDALGEAAASVCESTNS